MKIKYAFPLILLLGLSACTYFGKVDQPDQSSWDNLNSSELIGQTFTSTYDGLRGIVLHLTPGSSSEGQLELSVSERNSGGSAIRRSSLSIAQITSPGNYLFDFPPISGSANKDYYFRLSTKGKGDIQVGNAPADTYENGAQYINNEPVDQQLTFDLVYSKRYGFWGLIKESLSWSIWILAGLFLFIIPGWAIFRLVWPGWNELNWLEKLGLAGGMSISIYPVLFLWTDLIGLHLGRLYAILPGALGIVFLLVSILRNYRSGNFNFQCPIRSSYKTQQIWMGLSVIIVVLLVTVVRFFVIRTLDVPLWGDSYHHTMITQLLVDNRGLFERWEPYAELQSFTYHFGFHSLSAVFQWITGETAARSTLITGQILNILAVLSLYPLGSLIGKSRWAGMVTILTAGLLLSMPMFYINWGRYTQLAGQVILPVLMLFLWKLFEKRTNPWLFVAVGSVMVAGLALSHYRILILFLTFLLAAFIVKTNRGNYKYNLLMAISLGFGAFVLFSPWFMNIFGGGIYRIISNQISTSPRLATEFIQQYNSASNYQLYLPPLAWVLLVLILGWGLWRRDKWIAAIGGWLMLTWLATNPAWLGLPGSGAISNFTILIAAYIPASILIGSAAGWQINETEGYKIFQNQHTRGAAQVALFLLIIGLAIPGAVHRVNDLQIDEHSLLTRPDVHAFTWIQENISPGQAILVNSFFAFGGTTIVGSDGGWWLPFLAGYPSNLPPMPYVFEQGPRPGYVQWVNQLQADIVEKGISNPEVLTTLADRGITFIYIGQKQGSVNSNGNNLDLQTLVNDPHFEPVYHQDRVWIFRILSTG